MFWLIFLLVVAVLIGGGIFVYNKYARPQVIECPSCGNGVRGKYVDCSPAGPNPLGISCVMTKIICSCGYKKTHL